MNCEPERCFATMFSMGSNAPAMPPDDAPMRLDIAPDVVSLYWVDNVGIMVWHKPASAAVVDALHEIARPQRARYPTGMSFVHIGRVQLSLIDSATRQAFVRVLKDMREYVAATAVIAQANGFWANTVRSVTTAIVGLSRSPVEVRFHERPDELLEWLPARHKRVTGIELDVERLRRVLSNAVASLAAKDSSNT
jgi:hypothetical protein